MRDPLARDQRKAALRLGVLGRDDAAAREQRADHAGAAQREVVRHRQRGQIDGVGAEAARVRARAHVVQVLAMAARNQFRRARRAARELEARDVVRARRAVGDGRRVVQRIEMQEGVIVARDDDVRERRATRPQRVSERAAVELAEPGRAEICAGIREAAERADLVLPMRGQREHRPHAELEQREARFDEAHAVRQMHDGRVAAREAQAAQAAGETPDALEQRAVADAALAVDDRGRGGAAPRAIGERAVEGLVSPVAGGAVAAREVVGPVGRVARRGVARGGGQRRRRAGGRNVWGNVRRNVGGAGGRIRGRRGRRIGAGIDVRSGRRIEGRICARIGT